MAVAQVGCRCREAAQDWKLEKREDLDGRETMTTKSKLAIMFLAVLLAACATTASVWQRPGATDEAIKADIAACQGASAQSGYGQIGVTAQDYVTRCMEAKGYRPSM
jgi:hypothetical protein